MRIARLAILAALALSSCQERSPDFTFSLESPDKSRTALLQGYQPRGTIDGWLNLSLPGPGSDRTATFFRMRNANFGWVSPNTLVVVADRLEYGSIASHYAPDGTIRTETRLIICVRNELDCSNLEAGMGRNRITIAGFPEGLYEEGVASKTR